MERGELINKVDEIIAVAGDDEIAHSREDELHREIINLYCPKWVKDEIERLNEADFARWYA